MYNDSSCVPIDGVAMGAYLSVIIANLRLKKFKMALKEEKAAGFELKPLNDKKGLSLM